jgi:KAP family P-loop domain
MIIKDLFKSNINRDIKGVITVGADREEEIQKELEEYVITKELDGNFRKFAQAFGKSLDKPTEDIGIWISGFFGSGKSHFLKMLAYLLSNNTVSGKKALDYFQDKFPDAFLKAEYTRIATTGTTDVIIFNIDAKGAPDSKHNKEAIVTVLLNAFNEFQGFHPLHPWVAELERKMTKDDTYDSFKKAYQEKTGISWDGSDGTAPGRDSFDFEYEEIVSALVESGAMPTRKAAEESFSRASSTKYVINIERFSKMLREYCDGKGHDHRIVFFVDEVGQYIGSDSSLMLNLQTVSEELGKALLGRAWIIVTAQEAIDSVIKGIEKKQSDDFSKIMGRYATRLNLSSTNADEVIRKRLLEKKDGMISQTLKALYTEKSAILKNAISFSNGTAEMKTWRDEQEFIDCYPFIPYQIKLVQKVFEQIRRLGETGKHLSEGERSLLSAFHESAKAVADQEIGILVPVSRFFDSLVTFLEGSIRRVFDHASDNTHLQPHDLEVLKALFMIRSVKEVPCNVENLTTLLLDHLDADKISLRKQIQESLDRLVKETLVQQFGEEYIFLTDDEQEIGREIKATNIDDREVVDLLTETAFLEIHEGNSFAFTSWCSFPFDQRFDANRRGKQGYPLTVYILSPDGDGYDDDSHTRTLTNLATGTVTLRLPDGSYRKDAEEFKKTEKFLRLNDTKQNTDRYQLILASKRSELAQIKKRMKGSLEIALSQSEVFIEGLKTSVPSTSAKEKIDEALHRLASTIFSKFDQITEVVRYEEEVKTILKANNVEQLTHLAHGENKQALEEMLRHLDRMKQRDKRVTLRDLLSEFTGKPFGWNELNIQALIAQLVLTEKIRLFDSKEPGKPLDRYDPVTGQILLKTRESEKIIIKIREVTSSLLLNKAKKILLELTSTGNWPDKEDEFYTEAQNAFEQLIQQISALIERYQGHHYPGQDLLVQYVTLLKKVQQAENQGDFFQALETEENDLLDLAEDTATVKSFFESQSSLWDEADIKQGVYGKSEIFLSSQAREFLAEIRSILKMPSPYGRIKDLPNLIDQVRQCYESVLAKEKKDASSVINNHLKTAAEFLDIEGFSSNESAKLLTTLVEYSNKLNASNDINEVKSLAASIGNAYEAVLEDAEKLKHAKLPSSESTTPPPSKKKIKRVRLSSLITDSKPLKSEADIEEFLAKLKTRLLEEMKDQDEVRFSG